MSTNLRKTAKFKVCIVFAPRYFIDFHNLICLQIMYFLFWRWEYMCFIRCCVYFKRNQSIVKKLGSLDCFPDSEWNTTISYLPKYFWSQYGLLGKAPNILIAPFRASIVGSEYVRNGQVFPQKTSKASVVCRWSVLVSAALDLNCTSRACVVMATCSPKDIKSACRVIRQHH